MSSNATNATSATNATLLYNALLDPEPNKSSVSLINKNKTTIPLVPIPKTSLSLRKQHEITQTLSLLRDSDAEFIVDVGSGGGYLSRSLPSKYFINVETDPLKARSAVRNGLNFGAPNSHHVRSLDVDFKKFIDSHKKVNGDVPNGIIVGLDSCGALANEVIERFISNSIPGLNLIECYIVPCCHWKLNRFLHFELELDFAKYEGHDVGNWTHREKEEAAKGDDDWELRNWKYVVLENLVINDKVAYLENNGLEPTVEVVFDYGMSSRNICIVCKR